MHYKKQLEDQQKAICAQEDDIEQLQAQLVTLNVINPNQQNAPIQHNNQANMATQDQISTAVKTSWRFQTSRWLVIMQSAAASWIFGQSNPVVPFIIKEYWHFDLN